MSNYSEHFGQILDHYMRRRRETAKGLAERTYKRMGYSGWGSAAQIIGQFRKGCIYGTPSASGRSSKKALPRLAIALEELGVPEDHDLVRIVREAVTPFDASINGGFTYPPPEGFTLAQVEDAAQAE